MATAYELWETRSNNVIGAYVTEDAALAVVLAQLARRGAHAVDSWTLLREDEDEEVTHIAGGPDLALRATTRAGGTHVSATA